MVVSLALCVCYTLLLYVHHSLITWEEVLLRKVVGVNIYKKVHSKQLISSFS